MGNKTNRKSERNYYLEFVTAELKKEKKLALHPMHLKGKNEDVSSLLQHYTLTIT